MKLRSQTTRLLTLPTEVITEIVANLEKKDLKHVRGVSKFFFEMVSTTRLRFCGGTHVCRTTAVLGGG